MVRVSKSPFLLMGRAGLLLAIAGVGVSAYLTLTHYTEKVSLACPEGSVINCAKVTQSSYSSLFGIPFALLGLVYFLALVVLFLPPVWRSVASWTRNLRLVAVSLGVLTVFWLVYVELFRLNAICLYCTGLHVIIVLLFVLTVIAAAVADQ